MNITVLHGELRGEPQPRPLPSGDVVVAYEVAVPARDGGRPDTVPVVWPNPPSASATLGPGTEVVVVGRVRRRFFRAGGVTQSRTEVVAESIVPRRQTARTARAVGPVLDTLAGLRAR